MNDDTTTQTLMFGSLNELLVKQCWRTSYIKRRDVTENSMVPVQFERRQGVHTIIPLKPNRPVLVDFSCCTPH